MTKKQALFFLILILLLTAALASLTYFLAKKRVQLQPEKISPANTNTQVQDLEPPELDTSNWLTYRNEEYGFEFKYPAGWRVKERRNVTLFSEGGPIGEDFIFYPDNPKGFMGEGISLYIIKTNSTQFLNDLFEYFHKGDRWVNVDYSKVLVGTLALPALKISQKVKINDLENTVNYVAYVLLKNNLYFEIDYSTYSLVEGTQFTKAQFESNPYLDVIENMISNLKFF